MFTPGDHDVHPVSQQFTGTAFDLVMERDRITCVQDEVLLIANYLLTESEVFTGKSQTENLPYFLSIRQGRGLGKDRAFEVNKFNIVWPFALFFCRPVIGPWALRENNALDLANQRALYRLQTQAI